jgi:hypothetical protein
MVEFKYKNISGSDQAVMGVGIVAPGATFVTKALFPNSNFELQFDGDDKVGIEAPPVKPEKKTNKKGHK